MDCFLRYTNFDLPELIIQFKSIIGEEDEQIKKNNVKWLLKIHPKA